jgi:hypothetical protein
VPRTPPTIPLIAAPDTAPAAAVVVFTTPATPRVMPCNTPIICFLRTTDRRENFAFTF